VAGIEHHVGSRNRNVPVPSDIHTLGVIHTIVEVAGHGKGGDGAFGMVRDIGYVGRKAIASDVGTFMSK
jgi:hypothetical protein